MRSSLRPLTSGLVVSAALLAPAAIFAITPPPEPAIAPMIILDVESDADWNGIADVLDSRLANARRRRATEELEEMVEVETVFTRQIRQSEIDAFLALGGEIDFVFQSVSYGWHGRLPLGVIDRAARDLGSELVILHPHREVELYLQTATTDTRARDVWSGTPLGLPTNRGNAATRIAIFDTGIDGSHTDLAGRQAFWKDYTPDNALSPVDVRGHGTHVAGIAFGSGASQGGEAGEGMTLRYTVSNNLAGTTSGVFDASTQIEFRTGRIYGISHRGVWQGGPVSKSLGFLGRNLGSDGSYGVLGSLFNSESPYASNAIEFSLSNVSGLLPYLPQGSPASTTRFAQAVTVTNYHTPADGFPAYSGIAPLATWAGIKVFTNAGAGSTAYTDPAFDEMVTLRNSLNIQVVNLSLGIVGGLDSITRGKVNTLALNGIVPVVAAGNQGGGNDIGDPGRARLAITVGATNSANQVTQYSQRGTTTGVDASQDYKPDLLAPGGSPYFTTILSADTNDGDAFSLSLADQESNDLAPYYGTSMATPVVSGAVALLIDALQRNGHVWDFNSSDSVLLVKSILTMTAAETNQGRELGGSNPPTLQRTATVAPNIHPGKDRFEGYGALNIGAAVQAIENAVPAQHSENDIRLANTSNGPRAWAARVQLPAGIEVGATLDVPATHDLDLYLYAWEPGANGNPVRLAHSTTVGADANESLTYTSLADAEGILVVKCISGTSTADAATLNFTTAVPPVELAVGQVLTGFPGLFGIDGEVTIDVVFNESAFAVAPTARLQLNAGVGAEAEFLSKPAPNTARFLYVVQEGHAANPLAYPELTSLGPISDFTSTNPSVTIPAELTLPAFGSGNDLAASNVVIDGIRPAVTAINLLDPAVTDLDEVRFEVILSEALVALPNLSVDETGGVGADIAAVEPVGPAPASSFIVTVTLANPDANGTVFITVGTNNTDAAGNGMAADTPSEAYTIENTPVEPIPEFISVY